MNTLARSVVSLYMGFDLQLFNKVSIASMAQAATLRQQEEQSDKAWAEIEARAAAVKAEQDAKRAAEEGDEHKKPAYAGGTKAAPNGSKGFTKKL